MRLRSFTSPAFTLIEVLLAVTIITGLLAVALFFYQQAARLRTDLLVETEQITAARLLMDKMTTELRCARRHSYFETPLLGDATSIRFITTALPAHSQWTGEALGRVRRPETDLKYVTYKAFVGEDATNAAGLGRAEEPLVTFRTVPSSQVSFTPENTNRFVPLLLTDQLKSIQFRYWNGSAWQSSWNDTALPAAVEITLAPDASPIVSEEEMEFPAFDEELSDKTFRRIVYLPGSAVSPPSADTNLWEFF